MTHTLRAQSVAGIAAVLALPLLYVGGVSQLPALTAVGLVLFTAAMLTTPVLRFVVRAPAARSTNRAGRWWRRAVKPRTYGS